MTIPIGGAVRVQSNGRLAAVVRLSPAAHQRGTIGIRYPGETETRRVRLRDVIYVARRISTALAWEAAP